MVFENGHDRTDKNFNRGGSNTGDGCLSAALGYIDLAPVTGNREDSPSPLPQLSFDVMELLRKINFQERDMMRKLILGVFVLLLAFPVWAAPPQTEDQKALYALGASVGKQMEILNLSAEEYEYVKQGMADAAFGQKLVVEPDAYSQQINQMAQKRIQAAAQKQKDLAKPYMEKAAAQPGAKKTASGLIYQEIKAGAGVQARGEDTVKVHYTGTLIDGKEFDSSVKRGEPAEFPLGQIIPCWTEGVTMMKAGGKARLICPSEIAYGDGGRPPVIPGGATLIFEVELLEVKAPAAPQAQAPAAKPASKSASGAKSAGKKK